MTFVFTPLWGAVTDKSGMLKQILVLTFASSALLRVCLAARTSYLWIVTLITLTAIMNAPVRPLLDSGALQILDDRSEYGKQRLWGQWGFGVGCTSSPCARRLCLYIRPFVFCILLYIYTYTLRFVFIVFGIAEEERGVEGCQDVNFLFWTRVRNKCASLRCMMDGDGVEKVYIDVGQDV